VGPEDTAEARAGVEFIQQYYNLVMLGALPLMAALSRLVYCRRVYNLLEHLALNAFQVAVVTAAYLVMMPLIFVWPGGMTLYLVLAMGYQMRVYRQALGPGWFRAAAATTVITAAYTFAIALVARVLG